MLVLGVFVPLVMYASYKQQVLLRRNQVRDTKLMDDAGRVSVCYLPRYELYENELYFEAESPIFDFFFSIYLIC